MVSTKQIEKILKKNGTTFTSFSMPEIRELRHILTEHEQVKFCISGRYEGGFALLCATDQRLLLVDKKFMYLTIEDIRYDMIVEVDYSYRLMDAAMSVITPNKTLRFVSTKKQPLRNTATFVQHRVMALRQQQNNYETYEPQQRDQEIMAANTQPLMQQPDESAPLVSVHNEQEPVKQFVPRLPFRNIRKVANPYTQTPLSTRRRVSRFYPSS